MMSAEKKFGKDFLGNNKSTSLRRKFRTEFHVATLGWSFYEYGHEGEQKPDEFCRTLEQLQVQLEKKKLKIELLLCAGLTVRAERKSNFAKTLTQLSLRNISTIVFELQKKIASGESTNVYSLYNSELAGLKHFPKQIFGKTYGSKPKKDAITKKKCLKLQEQLLEGRRSFSIGKKNFVLLICGENNGIKGNKVAMIEPLIAKWAHSFKSTQKIADIFASSILLNPAHNPYKIDGDKRLKMMQHVTKGPIDYSWGTNEMCFQIPVYLHANNNYSAKSKKYENDNKKICSKRHNGIFLFRHGKKPKVVSFVEGDDLNFLVNVWSVPAF